MPQHVMSHEHIVFLMFVLDMRPGSYPVPRTTPKMRAGA